MDKNEIINIHKNGMSNRYIAKELGIFNNTVNSYVSGYKSLIKKVMKQMLQ